MWPFPPKSPHSALPLIFIRILSLALTRRPAASQFQAGGKFCISIVSLCRVVSLIQRTLVSRRPVAEPPAGRG
jgi:hypothetical protein